MIHYVSIMQGDPIDDDGFWQVGFRDFLELVTVTEYRFRTPGAALDWACKWAEDRGLVLAVDTSMFRVEIPRLITPLERELEYSDDVLDLPRGGVDAD